MEFERHCGGKENIRLLNITLICVKNNELGNMYVVDTR